MEHTVRPRPTRAEIVDAINAAGTLEKAARELGVARFTLWRWIKDHQIAVEKVTRAA